MKQYNAWYFSRVHLVLVYVAVHFTAFILLMMAIADIADETMLTLLALNGWALVFIASYYAALHIVGRRTYVNVDDENIIVKYIGTLPGFRLPDVILYKSDVAAIVPVYSGRGCITLRLRLHNGDDFTFHQNLHPLAVAPNFGDLVSLLLSSEDQGQSTSSVITATNNHLPAPNCPVIHRAVNYRRWARVLAVLIITANTLFLLVCLSIVADSSSATKQILAYLLIAIQGVVCTAVAILLAWRRLEVQVYNDRVVIYALCDYIFQPFRQTTYLYKDIRVFSTYSAGYGRATIETKDGRSYTFCNTRFTSADGKSATRCLFDSFNAYRAIHPVRGQIVRKA